jgi:rare lipoprotein A (peptidoglycan hydrolase)
MIAKNLGRHPICINEPIQKHLVGTGSAAACQSQMPNENGRRRMPFRQTIGISLALLMAAAGASAKAQETSASYHPAQPPNAEPGKSPNPSGKIRASQKRHQPGALGRFVSHNAARHRHRPSERDDATAAADGSLSEPLWGPIHATGAPQIGEAAWYNLVGYRTSSGEPLDRTTPTAAHRSLPLGSCARVTSLDTGRSVIVKINDRGPYRRRFIIDLSPRAAQALGMMHAGVAAVAIEPVAASPDVRPTDVAYRAAGVGSTQ